MSQIVSPFVEEFVEGLDYMLCKQNDHLAEWPYDARAMMALLMLSAIDFAKRNKPEPGQSTTWMPTKLLFDYLGIEPFDPGIPPLVIADEFDIEKADFEETVSAVFPSLDSFPKLLDEATPYFEQVREFIQSHVMGFLTWSRRKDGKLAYIMTEHGREFCRLLQQPHSIH